MRDVKGFIEEYDKKYMKDDDDKFNASDIMQLQEITEKNDDYIFNLISNCLYYGFMVGYKTRAEEGSAAISREDLLEVMTKVNVVMNTIESLHKSAFLHRMDGVIGVDQKNRSLQTEWENMRRWMETHYNVTSNMLEQSAIILDDVDKALNEWELQALHEEVRSEAGQAPVADADVEED